MFFSDWVHHHFVILHVMLSHSQLEVPAIWTSACAIWYLGSIILTFVWGCGPYLDILGPYLGWTCGPLSLPAMWVFTRKKAAHVHPHLFPPCERQQHLWLLRYNPTVSWVTNKLAHPRCQLLPERPTCHRNTVAGGLGGEGLRDETWNYCWFSGRTDKLYRNLT